MYISMSKYFYLNVLKSQDCVLDCKVLYKIQQLVINVMDYIAKHLFVVLVNCTEVVPVFRLK